MQFSVPIFAIQKVFQGRGWNRKMRKLFQFMNPQLTTNADLSFLLKDYDNKVIPSVDPRKNIPAKQEFFLSLAAIIYIGLVHSAFQGKAMDRAATPLHWAPAVSVDLYKRAPRIEIQPIGQRFTLSNWSCAAI